MPWEHAGLTGQDVICAGGWSPRYARVLAVSSDADHGLAVVDGNGDGAELEAESWVWDGHAWVSASSSGAGPLDTLGRVQTGGQIGEAHFAFGRAPGRTSVTVRFEGASHQVGVGEHGVWAFSPAALLEPNAVFWVGFLLTRGSVAVAGSRP